MLCACSAYVSSRGAHGICRWHNIDGRKKADLAKLIRRIKRESEKAGLYFNIKKTKIMTTANWNSFEIDGKEIEVVSCFWDPKWKKREGVIRK